MTKWYSSSIKLGELQILHILRSGGIDFFRIFLSLFLNRGSLA